MQYKIFRISSSGNPELEEELNLFLRSHCIISVQKNLQEISGEAYWHFCVEYLPMGNAPDSSSRGGAKVDYKDILSDSEFAIFAKLREARKLIANQDGVPVYSVATNEQLATMIQTKSRTYSDLKQIPGLGDSKVSKYGDRFLAILSSSDEVNDETSG